MPEYRPDSRRPCSPRSVRAHLERRIALLEEEVTRFRIGMANTKLPERRKWMEVAAEGYRRAAGVLQNYVDAVLGDVEQRPAAKKRKKRRLSPAQEAYLVRKRIERRRPDRERILSYVEGFPARCGRRPMVVDAARALWIAQAKILKEAEVLPLRAVPNPHAPSPKTCWYFLELDPPPPSQI